jgi:Glutamine synthetase, beta-Grasp domain
MSYDCKNPEDVLKTIKDDKIEMVDLRFADLPGLWQHFSVSPRALNFDSFAEGVGFDGSSIRGFQEIQESDMMVVPDPATAFLDPFTEAPTLVLICNIRDPITHQSYSRDVRHVAQKAETYLEETAVGDTAYFGPELKPCLAPRNSRRNFVQTISGNRRGKSGHGGSWRRVGRRPIIGPLPNPSRRECFELVWDKAIFLQKLAHEFQRGALVPFRLDQHIEDFALGVDGSPQVDHAAIDFQIDLVEMPDGVRLRPAFTRATGDHGSKMVHPAAHALIGHQDPALGKQILDVALYRLISLSFR